MFSGYTEAFRMWVKFAEFLSYLLGISAFNVFTLEMFWWKKENEQALSDDPQNHMLGISESNSF